MQIRYPFEGQMTVCAKFDKDIYLPEDAECYFVYNGSTQRHITFAERINDSALQSIIPESNRKETLLHLTVRLGLVKLSQFLLSQPGGPLALALPNEAGATPLDLASQNGHSRLVEIFMNFQGSHSFDISRAEISECAFLQFVHSSGTLTLTFNHTAERLLESDIKLFRKYFWDRTFLYKSLNSKQAGTVEGRQMPCNSTDSAEDPMNLASDEPAPGSEDVKPFRDPVVPSSENEDQVLLDIAKPVIGLDLSTGWREPSGSDYGSLILKPHLFWFLLWLHQLRVVFKGLNSSRRQTQWGIRREKWEEEKQSEILRGGVREEE
ncbi:rho guanine nucleotide exchange factor 28-like [Emys orbicularis]|uniref:rho guanine nucleotide exchange factor 28-like n=1 Tax=Emys orbicularis TaxID=82168 RepID=UPI0031FE27EB